MELRDGDKSRFLGKGVLRAVEAAQTEILDAIGGRLAPGPVPDDGPWILLALAAGACWAAYIVFSGRTGAAFPQLEGLALAMLVATVVILPFGLWDVARHGTGEWTAEVILLGLGIAVLSSVLPYSLELFALRRLAPAVFGILLSLEPAVAAIAGLLVLGQRLDPVQLLGMALVVLASVLVLGLGARLEVPPPDPVD